VNKKFTVQLGIS